jgi:hypothetical protein
MIAIHASQIEEFDIYEENRVLIGGFLFRDAEVRSIILQIESELSPLVGESPGMYAEVDGHGSYDVKAFEYISGRRMLRISIASPDRDISIQLPEFIDQDRERLLRRIESIYQSIAPRAAVAEVRRTH